MSDGTYDALAPGLMRGLKQHLKQTKLTGLQFRERTNDADKRINFAARKRQHKLPRQSKLHHQFILSRTRIPGVCQAALTRLKDSFGEIRLQLTADERRVIRVGDKLGRDTVLQSDQLERNRFTAEGEIGKKLLECFLLDVEIRRQGSLQFNQVVPNKRNRFRFIFGFRKRELKIVGLRPSSTAESSDR